MFTAAPQHGEVRPVGSTIIYTPTADYFGADAFSYRANDGLVNSRIATASITVAAVNDAPTFNSGANAGRGILEDAGEQIVSNWATALIPGPANESTRGCNSW